MWVKTVMEGECMFMAAWRNEEVDAARHRREKRMATRLGKSCYRTWKRRTCEVTPTGLVDEPKDSCTGAGQTETI